MPTWTTKTPSVVLSLVLLLTACSGNSESDAAPASGPDPTPTALSPSVTASPTPEPTATPLPTATIPVEPGDLAITRVVFGDNGLVELRNVGNIQANLRYFKLCQPPVCLPLEDRLEPGQVAWLTSSPELSLERSEGVLFDVGADLLFSTAGGEFALFETDELGATTGIVSYVQWGEDGHGATPIAVEGGAWIEGAYLETTGAGEIAAPESGTNDPGQWAISRDP